MSEPAQPSIPESAEDSEDVVVVAGESSGPAVVPGGGGGGGGGEVGRTGTGVVIVNGRIVSERSMSISGEYSTSFQLHWKQYCRRSAKLISNTRSQVPRDDCFLTKTYVRLRRVL